MIPKLTTQDLNSLIFNFLICLVGSGMFGYAVGKLLEDISIRLALSLTVCI